MYHPGHNITPVCRCPHYADTQMGHTHRPHSKPHLFHHQRYQHPWQLDMQPRLHELEKGLQCLNHTDTHIQCPGLVYGCSTETPAKLPLDCPNEGLCKMTGVFRTTPVKPLHNLTHVPPIPYVMNKLMHSYAHRLQDLPSSTKVHAILTTNPCQYWLEYVNPITNLS